MTRPGASQRIAVTGANGFIGQALVDRLRADGTHVVALTRREVEIPGARVSPVGDLEEADGLEEALRGVDCVIHLAARVHVRSETPGTDVDALYQAANVDASLRLAQAALAARVRRFVFVSTVKVLGENSGQVPFGRASLARPEDAYAQSKWNAEQVLKRLATETELELAVVRPPLVYGPGVGANFQRLMRLVARGVPLPLGAVHNRRSMIALENLVDLLARCASHPRAAGQTFLASDGPAVSTPDLIRVIAAAMGRSPRLVPVPEPLLRLMGRVTGRQTEIERLCGSLQVDDRQTRELLEWAPPLPFEAGVEAAVAAFVRGEHN